MKYKKYIVFGYNITNREAAGGLNDIIDSFDTIEEAKNFCHEEKQTIWGVPFDRNEIVDRDTWGKKLASWDPLWGPKIQNVQ